MELSCPRIKDFLSPLLNKKIDNIRKKRKRKIVSNALFKRGIHVRQKDKTMINWEQPPLGVSGNLSSSGNSDWMGYHDRNF